MIIFLSFFRRPIVEAVQRWGCSNTLCNFFYNSTLIYFLVSNTFEWGYFSLYILDLKEKISFRWWVFVKLVYEGNYVHTTTLFFYELFQRNTRSIMKIFRVCFFLFICFFFFFSPLLCPFKFSLRLHIGFLFFMFSAWFSKLLLLLNFWWVLNFIVSLLVFGEIEKIHRCRCFLVFFFFSLFSKCFGWGGVVWGFID